MDTIKYLIFLDIFLILRHLVPDERFIKLSVSDIMKILEVENYRFQEYSLLFVVYFIFIPILLVCTILTSFKIYTHDFVKPITKSYLTYTVYYLSSIIYCLFVNDLLIIFNNNLTLNKISKDDNYMFLFSVFTKLVTIILNFIFMISFFLLSEVHIAFKLNFIPMSNISILGRNMKCIGLVLFTLLLYFISLIQFLCIMYKNLNSIVHFFYVILISFSTAFVIGILFYYFYVFNISSYINRHSRSPENYIM